MCNFPVAEYTQTDGEKSSDVNGIRDGPVKKHPSKLENALDKVPLPFLMYVCFVFAVWFILIATGPLELDKAWNHAGSQLEILGLVMVREKIKNRNSVGGISGNTFVMVAMVSLCRFFYESTVDAQERSIGGLIMEFSSFLLAADILKAVFVTHYETYDAELDRLKAWYLIPACFALALVVRPQHWIGSSLFNDWLLSGAMYVDTLMLMPQVVLMAMSDGRVEVPIANFAAASGIVKCGDLFHTLFIIQIAEDISNWRCFYMWMSGELDAVANAVVMSYTQCILVHIVQLVLLIDFSYYLVKARVMAMQGEDVRLFADDMA